MNLSHFRRYGRIYLGAGMVVTGSLWFTRQDRHIRGEDVAECLAAVAERQLAFYAGSNSWDGFEFVTTNYTGHVSISGGGYVDEFIRHSTMYTHILDASRNLALAGGGDQNQINIFWLDATAAPETMPLLSLGVTWEYEDTVLTPFNPEFPDMTRRRWYISNWLDADYTETLPLVRTKWPGDYRDVTGAPATITPIVDTVLDRTADSLAFEWPFGNWWQKPPQELGSTVYGYSCETYTNDTVKVSKWIRTADLDEAKTVLSGLSRTVMLLPLSDAKKYMTATSFVENTVSSYFTTSAYANGGAPDLVSRQDLNAGAEFNTGVNTDSPFTRMGSTHWSVLGEFGEVSSWRHATYTNNTPPSEINWYLGSYYQRKAFSRALLGCRLLYPSQFAVTEGYVLKIRVYTVNAIGLIRSGLPNEEGRENLGYFTTPYDLVSTTADGGACDPESIQAFTQGLFPATAWPEFPATPDFSFTHQDVFAIEDASARGLANWAMVLVDEWNAGDDEFVFTLGKESPPEFDYTVFAETKYGLAYTDPSTHAHIDSRSHQAQGEWNVDICYIVIVVDWDWKHLNPSHPYEPEPYTPPKWQP